MEVEVQAHTRRYHRNPGCTCETTPAIITAAPPPRLIPHSIYGVSFWVEVILSKYRYGQPTIGWTHEQRKRNLQLVVNNARFLILPWI